MIYPVTEPMRIDRAFILAFWLAAPSFAVYAHHSMSEYADSLVEEITGEVTEVRWANPHIRLKLIETDASGSEILWSLEALPRSQLDRNGIPSDAVSIGDQVTVAGTPSTRRAHLMMARNIRLSDGRELMVHPRSQPRWGAQILGSEEQSIEESRIRDARETASGIFRVWTQETRLRWPDEFPLTATAEAKHKGYDAVIDNPFADCTPPGMPRAITGAWPIEFIQADGKIIIRLEDYGLVRTIHMYPPDTTEPPPATPLGYSIGRWEGNTLVVETTQIDYPYFTTFEGVPQSPELEITERFTQSADESRLNFEITAVDTEVFTEPVTGTRTWIWKPGTELNPHECATEG